MLLTSHTTPTYIFTHPTLRLCRQEAATAQLWQLQSPAWPSTGGCGTGGCGNGWQACQAGAGQRQGEGGPETLQHRHAPITSGNPVLGLWLQLQEWGQSPSGLYDRASAQDEAETSVSSPHKHCDGLPTQSWDWAASDTFLAWFQTGLILLSLWLFHYANELTPAIC